MQVRLGHGEIAAADVNDLGIDLDAVDRHRPINRGELPGDRSAGQPDQRDPAGDVAGSEKGREQDIVPVAVRVQGGRIVDRMHRRPFIEQELGLGSLPDHLDVVVG